MFIGLICSLLCLALQPVIVYCTSNQPVIGVLSLPKNSTHSYIANSYVKWLEASGARVIPLVYSYDDSKLLSLAQKVDGIFFTGGQAFLVSEDGSELTEYGRKGKLLLDIALKLNTPLWGTCLGFELLSILLSNNTSNPGSILESVESENEILPLQFNYDSIHESKMYKNAPSDVVQILSQQSVTVNEHRYGLAPRKVEKIPDLYKNIRVLSTNTDDHGIDFISSWEHKTKPIYATQFHPEKNSYEWNAKKIPSEAHTSDAIYVMQYLSRFFVNSCRQRNNSMSLGDLNSNLIQNWPIVFTPSGYFIERYIFKATVVESSDIKITDKEESVFPDAKKTFLK